MEKQQTPWGVADFHEHLAEGVDSYGTPSHGGIRLSAERQRLVRAKFPDHTPFAGGAWYEEDCDWAYVALTFPELFDEGNLEQARATIAWLGSV